MGDLNMKLMPENDELHALTSNGKILLEVIRNQELDVLNFDEVKVYTDLSKKAVIDQFNWLPVHKCSEAKAGLQ